MSDERAERLREAIAYVETPHVGIPDWAADMPTRVLRAIVRELGITREMVASVRSAPEQFAMPDVGQEIRLADAAEVLSTLLDAAGQPCTTPDGPPETEPNPERGGKP